MIPNIVIIIGIVIIAAIIVVIINRPRNSNERGKRKEVIKQGEELESLETIQELEKSDNKNQTYAVGNKAVSSIMDLQSENPEDLETISGSLLDEWKSSGRKEAWYGLGAITFSIIGIVILNFMNANYIIEAVIFIACLVLIYKGITYLASGNKKLNSNPPLAGLTPEESLERFFETCITTIKAKHGGKIGVISKVEAYLCLLNLAKEEVKTIKGFSEAIEKDAKKLWSGLEAIYGKGHDEKGLNGVDIVIEEMNLINDDGTFLRYETTFILTAYTGQAGSSYYPLREIGQGRLNVFKELAKVGNRFYLTDSECDWIIV